MKRGVRRDGKGVLQETFVETLRGQRMYNLKKPQCGGKHLEGFTDGRLGRARHGHDCGWPRRILVRLQKVLRKSRDGEWCQG